MVVFLWRALFVILAILTVVEIGALLKIGNIINDTPYMLH